MKAIKEFRGVKNGDIYPTVIAVGEEIPEELEAAAVELGCAKAPGKKASGETAPPAGAPASGEAPAS